MEKQEIARISGDEFFLSTDLAPEAFAKTNFSEFLNEENLLVSYEKGKIKANKYKFSGTKADENGLTIFLGSSKKFPKGKLISQCGENDNFAFYAYSKAVDFISQSKGFEEFCKAGGGAFIDADEKNETAQILFINPALFESCARNHKEKYAELQGKLIYKGLEPLSSLYFTRAVLSYKALTGRLPFNESDTTKRQEDYFDRNFIPIELYCENIKKELAQSINSALSLSVKTQITAGMRNLSDKKAEYRQKMLLESAEKFDSELFKEELYKTNANKTEENKNLAERREKYSKKLKRHISAKRFLRRNKNRILTAFAALIVAGWFVNGYIKQNEKLITTKGLTSTQATAALYAMMNQSDVPNLQEIVSGKETKGLLIKISGLYVSSKQRLEASPMNGTVTPEEWFYEPKNKKVWMLGLTNLKIDGIKTELKSNYKTKKDKPKQIALENGKILTKGDEVTHTAEYNYIRQAEAKIFIDRMTDTVTLRWDGKQWKVVKVDGKLKADSVSSKDFTNEYYGLLETENNDGAKVTERLREKYDWLPTKN